MMPQAFTSILDAVLNKIAALAESMFEADADTAKMEAQTFIKNYEESIYIWFVEYKGGKLSDNDLEYLLQSIIELANMTALKEAGIVETQLNQFRSGIVNVIIQAISNSA